MAKVMSIHDLEVRFGHLKKVGHGSSILQKGRILQKNLGLPKNPGQFINGQGLSGECQASPGDNRGPVSCLRYSPNSARCRSPRRPKKVTWDLPMAEAPPLEEGVVNAALNPLSFPRPLKSPRRCRSPRRAEKVTCDLPVAEAPPLEAPDVEMVDAPPLEEAMVKSTNDYGDLCCRLEEMSLDVVMEDAPALDLLWFNEPDNMVKAMESPSSGEHVRGSREDEDHCTTCQTDSRPYSNCNLIKRLCEQCLIVANAIDILHLESMSARAIQKVHGVLRKLFDKGPEQAHKALKKAREAVTLVSLANRRRKRASGDAAG
ncbi:uncharacterized protein BP01DRAFT_386272 [Aspergillus saccharolyticus JOP 1030-1]|uniref:Uncharacterized protein n=1 Tax=Aspergillus saccharolyticus JOP 1030-1 TaxID=1450539 RepID=A0A318ZN48_9EURO|nr:hypothetical protein BP01DRAFT_386272 [Aspergillus saccharolyticus JOP 1030-1]PYH41588.1 hypothetical protein BP01DRAFT_386272 [Aspergillus saccharolyticus JOP 1030-1]